MGLSASGRHALDSAHKGPALFPQEATLDLNELRGSRHVVHHAYDLTLLPDRVALVLDSARRIAAQLPSWVADFCSDAAQRTAEPD